jgi:hypothetical protein
VNQTVLSFTLLVTALAVLVIAVIVLRLLWSAGRIPVNRTVEKRFAYQWLPLLGTMLRAAGNFLRAVNTRGSRNPREKHKQIRVTQNPNDP